MAEIVIAPHERTFIAGMTGSGKTYLSKILLKNTDRLVVFDSKDALMEEMELEPESKSSWRKLRNGKPIRMQIKEPIALWEDIKPVYEEKFMRLFYIPEYTLFLDELTAVTKTPQDYPLYLEAIYKRGRQQIRKGKRTVRGGLSVVANTQRPSNIPVFTMTESENAFVFMLQNPDDRDRVAAYHGKEMRDIVPDKHGFYYHHIGIPTVEYHASLS